MVCIILVLCSCVGCAKDENIVSASDEAIDAAAYIESSNDEETLPVIVVGADNTDDSDKHPEDIADNGDLDKLSENIADSTDSEEQGEVVDDASDSEEQKEDVADTEEVIPTGDFYIKPITDDIKARITGVSYPGTDGMQITYDDLVYVHVLYNDYNGQTQQGEIICNKSIGEDILDIFDQLYAAGYQIAKIKLIDEYGGDDDASCADDNTSCFNYRVMTGGKKLSKHAYGLAIDINPYYNPYVTFKNGTPHVLLDATAAYIDRSQEFPHKIDYNDLCYKLFMAHGFKWGGDWNSVKDYQHFEK